MFPVDLARMPPVMLEVLKEEINAGNRTVLVRE